MSHGFEAMLLRWSNTSNGGATVTLQLQDEADLDWFRNKTMAKGKIAGQRLMVGVEEIGPDEKPVADQWTPSERAQLGIQGKPPLEINKIKAPIGARCKLAAIWCNELGFQHWFMSENKELAKVVSARLPEAKTYDELAAEMVRVICGITSRRELDTNAAAGQTFDTLIRYPYREYLGDVV